MSLINQMLQDLEKRRASSTERSALPNQIRVLPPVEKSGTLWWLFGSGGAAAPATPAENTAVNSNCNDGRTNCSRGEAPEADFPERTNERVRPQFTVGVPSKTSK